MEPGGAGGWWPRDTTLYRVAALITMLLPLVLSAGSGNDKGGGPGYWTARAP